MKKVFMDCSSLINEKMYKLEEKKHFNYVVNHFKVDANNEKTLKRIRGDYYTICFDEVVLQKSSKNLTKEVMKILKKMMGKNMPKPLIIGLGNSSVLCDSLGIHVTNQVMATNHFTDFLNLPKVALFNPEVVEKTGISSFSLIEMVVKSLKPTIIIMIDSLATSKDENLNHCIEINNTGIIPGSAIKDNKKIDANTFQIPVLSIGVPLVLEYHDKYYASANVHEVINASSKIIADALNQLFF